MYTCLESGASQQFCYGSGDTHSSGRGEAREEASFCPDCAVISQGFYSRSEKLNTNFYTDSAEVRHLGTWAGQLSGIQMGQGAGFESRAAWSLS